MGREGFDPEGGEDRTMNRTHSGDVQYSDGELGISQCVWCRHRSAGGGTCQAFPKGIPEAIARNKHDHRYPYDGDYGVRFEPETVEIEFVGVETEADSVSLTAELAVAMARAGGGRVMEEEPEEPSQETGNVTALEDADFELDDDVFDLSATASG